MENSGAIATRHDAFPGVVWYSTKPCAALALIHGLTLKVSRSANGRTRVIMFPGSFLCDGGRCVADCCFRFRDALPRNCSGGLAILCDRSRKQKVDLVDFSELEQQVALAASSPGVSAAAFAYCRSFLNLRRAGKNRTPPGCQVSIPVPH